MKALALRLKRIILLEVIVHGASLIIVRLVLWRIRHFRQIRSLAFAINLAYSAFVYSAFSRGTQSDAKIKIVAYN